LGSCTLSYAGAAGKRKVTAEECRGAHRPSASDTQQLAGAATPLATLTLVARLTVWERRIDDGTDPLGEPVEGLLLLELLHKANRC
jgi:hypothetical protein